MAIAEVVRGWAALLGCLLFLALGLLAGALKWPAISDASFLAASVIGLALCITSLVGAIRHRRMSVDVLAVIALAGAVLIHEFLAAAVVSLMLASGQLLEARAQRRSARDLSELVERAPRTARIRRQGAVELVTADVIRPGDVIVVGPGEVVPVDGRLMSAGMFDEAALTGEPLPVERGIDDLVRSGVVNAGSAVDVLATSTAQESTYAGVVRLVQQASATTAPFVRGADRVASYFVPLALLLAGFTWFISGSSVRAVSVLVIATPCPLLLAAPIAIMTGLARAARAGVIVKGGSALERLADGTVLLLDKTGTVTRGHPTVTTVIPAPESEPDDVLTYAASLEQLSPHVLASALVMAARRRGVHLLVGVDVLEVPGCGIKGIVDGHRVRVGKQDWVAPGPAPGWIRQLRRRAALDGSMSVCVSVDDEFVGGLTLVDPIRPDAPRMIRSMRRELTRIVLVSGDRSDIATAVGRLVGVDQVYAEQDPASKVEVVRLESKAGRTIMVGDGVNDAPAMAAANVGVALAARGASAASEAADVVLNVDRIDALGDAIVIARRSRRIAMIAACVGMGVAGVFMGIAAVGRLTPTAGAVLQEGIDVLAIAIALTGLLPWPVHTVSLSPADRDTMGSLRDEHESLSDLVEAMRLVADQLTIGGQVAPAANLISSLEDQLLPHEQHEEKALIPVLARALGGQDPTGSLSRTHVEIEHRIARLSRLVAEIGSDALTPDDVLELRRDLYGLYAILTLHNAQEEESAFSLLSEDR